MKVMLEVNEPTRELDRTEKRKRCLSVNTIQERVRRKRQLEGMSTLSDIKDLDQSINQQYGEEKMCGSDNSTKC